jgi:8-oxo-dGTP diphosphatase
MLPTVTQHSAGGVVYRRTSHGYQVVLIATQNRRVWGLPKGGVRKGESPLNAALRTVQEETGIRALAGPIVDRSEYWYEGRQQDEQVRFHKRVDYHLMRALTHALQPDSWKIDDAAWLPIDVALVRATYAAEREILTRARALLRSPGGESRFLPPLLAHLLGDLPTAALAALAETDVWANDDVYAIVAAPSAQRDGLLAALGAIQPLITIDDGDEFTVVLSESQLDDLPPLLARTFQVEYGYRFVHLEATLPWDTVGYGAAIFAALASAGLSAGFYSGYSIDYLLVRNVDLLVALAALEALIEQAQRLPER